MFDYDSRYAALDEATQPLADGRQVRYKRRRLIPSASRQPGARAITVRQGDRPDTLAAQHLGEAAQFWRLCDANDVIDPWELTERAGRRIIVAQEGGQR